MAKLTPMMEQYFDVKNRHRNCLLFFRLGDFYELFFDDALIASKELDITLTGRDCGQEERAPMCGVPYHSADGYIAKLIEKGYKVAICEQLEDPKLTKNIVKRDVIRIVTPGTILDSNILDEHRNNYIMCVCESKAGFGLAVADVTTGEFLTASFRKAEDRRIIDEIARFNPSEIIVNDGYAGRQVVESVFGRKTYAHSPWAFDRSNAYKRLTGHFKVLNLHGFGLEDDEDALRASGALLDYLYETQKNALTHIAALKKYTTEKYMNMDISSRRNLELTETIRERGKKNTLLWVLDRTKTAMGARLLRKWLEQPLLDASEIRRRLDAVGELAADALLREELRELLGTVHDIERILSRLIYATAGARDLAALKNSLRHFSGIKAVLSNSRCELLAGAHTGFDELTDIFELIEASVVDGPPFGVREGGFIRDGFSAELDRVREAKHKGSVWLAELEAREKAATGIKNLRIKYNKIFGYCIEITNSHKELAPERYVRRQTLANCERYVTDELKEIEEAITGADGKQAELEYQIFTEIRESIIASVERIQLSAYIVAAADAIASLADVADKCNYCKPEINEDGIIDIKNGRHPVVERMTDVPFVPNDTYLDKLTNRLAIITGPNMAGKSTYMRQVALIVLMAQIGSFVPAESASISLADSIFTRVGAADDLATGQSTFMVEMSEVANILNNATADSLIILDEIGRGTSTFDGLSIAWAVLEHIADRDKLGARTLFATHYHEMTELEGKVDGVSSFRVTVRESGEDIVFLRKIERGAADNSYGIHVARLAGLPRGVLGRSAEILSALNNADITKRTKDTDDGHEAVYYVKRKENAPKHNLIMRELMQLDVDAMSPREALRALYELKHKTEGIGDDLE